MGAKQSAELRKALGLLSDGLTVREAAKESGVVPSTIYRALASAKRAISKSKGKRTK